MNTENTKKPDLNALAMEACDMWQEQLSNIANNPELRSEFTKFLEPQRKLFSEWTKLMQEGFAAKAEKKETSEQKQSDAQNNAPQNERDSLRVAQLALRVSELERRLSLLEAKQQS